MKKEYKYLEDFAPYPSELIKVMYEKRILGLPISFYLLDLRKTNTYCHYSAILLSSIIEGSDVVTADIEPLASYDDKSHSWVEKDNLVYDTTQGLVWLKDSYYEKVKPSNIIKKTKEEKDKYMSKYTNNMTGSRSFLVARVIDLYDNKKDQGYGRALKRHLDLYCKEKNITLDEQATEELNNLKSFYNEISDFTKGKTKK